MNQIKMLTEKVGFLEAAASSSNPPAPAGAPMEANKVQEDMEEDWDDDEIAYTGGAGWQQVLGRSRVQPTGPGAPLCDLLQSPPPLTMLRAQQQSCPAPTYDKIPETPAARRNQMDAKLQMPQHKLENCMHTLVHALETNNPASISTAAAFVRSAWEDIHQLRREMIAGKGRSKLDRRTDDNRARLLTTEEEHKVQQARTQRPQWRSSTFRPTADRGGKGKGKGRSPRRSSPDRKSAP